MRVHARIRGRRLDKRLLMPYTALIFVAGVLCGLWLPVLKGMLGG